MMSLSLQRFLLVIAATSGLWAQNSSPGIAVQLFVQGGSDTAQALAAKHFSEALNKVHGIVLTQGTKIHSDYLVMLEVDDREINEGLNVIALGVRVLDRMDLELLQRLYMQSDYKKQAIPLESTANLTPRLAQSVIRAGRLQDVPQMCRDIVELLDQEAFRSERQFPHGARTFDEAFANFIGRLGGKAKPQ
jgi:hypothetical protein